MKKNDLSYVLPLSILIVVFFFSKEVSKLFGGLFGQSKIDKDNEQAISKLEAQGITNPFSPTYVISVQKMNVGKTIHYLKASTSDEYAKQIFENLPSGWGVFSDNVGKIVAVFSTLSYKTQVSQVAASYNRLYNEDLLSTIKGLDDSGMILTGKHREQMDSILKRVAALPPF